MPDNFYRVSIKALIWDTSGQKFAVVLEDNGWWELPGGGLNFGETPDQCLRREIREEMGLEVISVKPTSYYLIGKNMRDHWSVGLVFETQVKDFNFIKTSECQELKFILPEEVKDIHAWRTVTELAGQIIHPPPDPLYADARRLVIKHGKSSLSFLQMHLFIDLDRAVKIRKQLVIDGIIDSN